MALINVGGVVKCMSFFFNKKVKIRLITILFSIFLLIHLRAIFVVTLKTLRRVLQILKKIKKKKLILNKQKKDSIVVVKVDFNLGLKRLCQM